MPLSRGKGKKKERGHHHLNAKAREGKRRREKERGKALQYSHCRLRAGIVRAGRKIKKRRIFFHLPVEK